MQSVAGRTGPPKMASQCVNLLAFLSFAICLSSIQAVPWVAEPRTDEHSLTRHEQLLNLTKARAGTTENVIFLGASSVEHWGWDGKEVWDKHYAPRHALNYGVNGDRTEHVLWRIEHGELDNINAKLVVLIIGSNNVHHPDKPEDTTKGVGAILTAVKAKLASAKVLLLSILPRGTNNHHVHLTNQLIAHLEDKKTVFFLDLTTHFETSPEHQNEHLFVADRVHLTKEGYQVWYEAMEPLFSQLIAP